MSLLRDLAATVGDALRLSNDLMRYKLEVQAQAFKRGVSRMATFLVLLMAAALLAGTALGFLLYGTFIYIAAATNPAAAGLIVGFGLLLVAIIVLLVGRSVLRRS